MAWPPVVVLLLEGLGVISVETNDYSRLNGLYCGADPGWVRP